MKISSRRLGYIRNSVSFFSLFAFFISLLSFACVEFFYASNQNNSNTISVKDRTTAYRKELDTLPIDVNSLVKMKLVSNSPTNVYRDTDIKIDLVLYSINPNYEFSGGSFVIFVPKELTFINKPTALNFSNIPVNYVVYKPVTNGTEIQLAFVSNPNTFLKFTDPLNIFSFSVKATSSGLYKIDLPITTNYPTLVLSTNEYILDKTSITPVTLNIQNPVLASPIITPQSGDFSAPGEITIDNPNNASFIKYTVDGSDPKTSTTAKVISTFPFTTTLPDESAITLRAYSYGTNFIDSPEVSTTYRYVIAPLKFAATQTQNLTTPFTENITTDTPGVVFYYTDDGTEPVVGSSKIFPKEGLPINHTQNLKIKAYKKGYLGLFTYQRSYTFVPATFTFIGPGNCTTSLTCNVGILESDVDLVLTVKSMFGVSLPKKFNFGIFSNGGNSNLLTIEDIKADSTGVYKVVIPNYRKYVYIDNVSMGFIFSSFSDTNYYSDKAVIATLGYLPKISAVTPQKIDTYDSTALVQITANADTGKSISKLIVLSKDLSTGVYSPIKTITLNKPNLVDYLLNIDLSSLDFSSHFYKIQVIDTLGLITDSPDLIINYFDRGDVNKDFKLDIPNDFITMIRAYFDSQLEDKASMDIDNNGTFDISDLIKFLKKYFS